MQGRETPEREDWVKHTSWIKLGHWGNRYFNDSLVASFQIFGGVTLKGHNELGWYHRGNLLLSLYIPMFKDDLCVWGEKYISHPLWIPPPSFLHHICGLIFSYSFWKICWFFKNGNPSRINWNYFASYFCILLVMYLYLNVQLAIILIRYYSF